MRIGEQTVLKTAGADEALESSSLSAPAYCCNWACEELQVLYIVEANMNVQKNYAKG